MRRSKSSSNIPLPKRSIARASSEERLKYTTPVRAGGHHVTSGLNSAASSGRRPPSTLSRRLLSSATSSNRKSIQALSCDKKWVDQQYEKVCIFIQETNLFPDKSISSNIKPLTLKSFVYIMNILLGEIFSNIEITSENYKEIIQQKLKVLRYPGTISISTLKCVNVPHSFPQVIAMIAFLVDKVSFQMSVKGGNRAYLPKIMPSKTSQITFEYFIKRYVAYNESPETDLREMDKEYIGNIREVLNIDENVLKEYEKKIKKNQEIVKGQEKSIKALEDSNVELINKTEVLQDEIQQFEKTEPTEEISLNSEIEHLQHCINTKGDMCDKKKENIKSLQELIKQQPYSQQDKLELLKKIDSLEELIKMEKEKMDHLGKLQEEFISKHDLEKEKVKEAVKKWNNRLIKWTIYKPELKQFLLEEGTLEEDSFFDRVKQVQEEKKAVDKQLNHEKNNIDSLLSKHLERKGELQAEVSSIEAMLKELEDKLKALETKNASLSLNLKKNDTEIKETKKNLQREISKLQQECAQLEEINKKMATEIEGKICHLKDTNLKAVKYFTQVYYEIKTTWDKASEMCNNIEGHLLEKKESLQDIILEVLGQLENASQNMS